MKFNLTKKLIIFIEIIITIVLIVGSVVTYIVIRNSLQEQIYSQLKSISILKESSINLYLKTGITEIEYIAKEDKILTQFLENTNKVYYEQITEDFLDIVNENKTLENISLIDRYGKVIISTNKNEEGKFKSNEEFFSKTKQKTIIQDYYFNINTNKPAMFVSTPIFDNFGKFMGILVGDINVDEIDDLISSRAGLGITGESFAVNSFNMVVTNLQKMKDSAFHKTIYLPQIQDCLNGNSIAGIRQDYNNDQVIGYWGWFPELKSCLVIKIDTNEAFAPIKKAIIIFIFILLLLGVILGYLSYVAGNAFILPFQKLRDKIIKIKDGNFDVNLDINSKDEIGEMATVFNEMAKSLSNYKVNIESEVVSRTIDLDDKVTDLEKNKKATLNLLEDLEKEKKLSESQAAELTKFKLVIDNTSQHIIITDIDGIIIYANHAVEIITGYSINEVIGQKPSLWGMQMPTEFYTDLWKTIKVDKKTFSGEITNKRKNGEIYTAKSFISPVLDDSGDIKFFVGLETDISKEKSLESALIKEKESVEQKVVERTRELSEEHARLLSSINSIPFGFIIFDNNENIIIKNDLIIDMLKFDNTKLPSMNDVIEFLSKDDNVKIVINTNFKDKKVCELKEIAIGAKTYRGIIAPIKPDEGQDEIIGHLFMLEDITEAKILERSKDEFFAVASHELRTPLTAIRGNSSMLLDSYTDKVKDKDVNEMLVDINQASVRLIGIVNDFLDVSRLEQGKIEIKNKEFDMFDLVEKVLKSEKEMAEAKNLTLEFVKGKIKSVNILSDQEKTEQVLLNLVGNSIKFATKGKVTISIIVIDNFMKISVSDEGPGISEKSQNLLFRKFQPASEDILTRDVTKSTGLGLYISKLLVSKMGGTIGLEKSVIGEGSTFFFTLPLKPLD